MIQPSRKLINDGKIAQLPDYMIIQENIVIHRWNTFSKYIFIQVSIEGRTSGETSLFKHKSESKKRPILQRHGSKDSLSGQSNQPAYVEQLLKLKEKKRCVINFDF